MRELLNFSGKYKFFMFLSWLLAALSSLIAILPFWYIWKIMGIIIFSAGSENISRYGFFAVSSSIIAILVYISALMFSHLAAFRIAANIRIKLLQHISLLPLGIIEAIGSGKLRRLIINTSENTETYLAHQLPDKYASLSSSAGLAILLFYTDWQLALISLAPIILGFVIMAQMTGESMKQKISEYQKSLAVMSNEAVEYIRGMPVIKTFGQSIYTFRKFQEAIQNYEAWTSAYTNELRPPMMCYILAVNGAFIFLIPFGLFKIRSGLTGEFIMNFILAVIAAPLISVMLTRTIRLNENRMITENALKQINEVLNLKPLSIREDDIMPEKNPDVKIENVSFTYNSVRKNHTISDISLSLNPGQILALVGNSGGGKTTLAKLIARFFDVNKGRILIGGADVRDIKPEELMRNISFVFQDSRLIKGSILENITLSKPDAAHDEIMQALENAQCSEIIAKLPDGINTIIGSGGVYLSGGEAQRIAIARAFLKNSPVIILDEAAAYSDPDNERQLQKALNNLAKDRTVIMIAHRLSSVRDANIIAVLWDGKIIETGNFEQLINLGGKFKSIWDEYNKSLSWKITKEAE